MKIDIKLRDTNLVTGSIDLIRQTLGGYYAIEDSSTDTIGEQRTLVFKAPNTDTSVSSEALGSYAEAAPEYAQAAMISSVIINSDLATTASADSMFPYYTMPLSIVGVGPSASPDDVFSLPEAANILNSDEKWKTYIQGGTFDEVEYPGVYNSGPFNINNLDVEVPYDLLYAKTVNEENYSSYETIESKSVYNMYLPDYQDYQRVNSEESLLSIYDLLYCDVHSQLLAFDDVQEQISLAGLYDHDSDSIFNSSEIEIPALIKTDSDIYESCTDSRKYIDLYENARQYYYSIAVSGAFAPISGKSNIMFNKQAIADLFPSAFERAEAYGAYYPFYNKIGMPKFDGGSLNSLIVTRNFSDLLLNSINDAFVLGKYGNSTNDFAIAQKYWALSTNGELFENQEVTNMSSRYVDFKNVILNVANNSAPSADGNYRFAGEAGFSTRAAIPGQDALQHINKKNATNMIDGIQKGLLSLEPVGSLPADIAPDVYMPWSNLDDFKFNDFLSLTEGELNSKAECVAFRINKRNLITGEESNFIIQNQPSLADSEGLFSAEGVGNEEWSYYDTQVRYGQTYEYTTHAYFMVVGYEYEYSDLVLSRRISEYGQYGEGEVSADGDFTSFTCIEFYDPSTGETKPSPMKTDENLLMSNFRVNVMNETPGVGYATSAQELVGGSHLNYADFNIRIEPTIKIFEVTTNVKQLTVLDNPPPKPEVQPYQVKDQSQAIGFFIKLENPPVKDDMNRDDIYPTPLNELERIRYGNYLASQNLLDTDKLKFGTVSRPSVVEVYRLSSKPESMSDFDGNLVATKSLILSQNNNEQSRTYITPTCFHEERISTGHKFYYCFRFLNENNVASPWSPIIECELIDDGGYKYANFDYIMEGDIGQGVKYDDPSTQFKKILMLRPAIPQVDFNTADLDYSLDSSEEYDNARLGSSLSDSLWNKKYKIRLTSKKTGKKIDLNVNYKLVEGS